MGMIWNLERRLQLSLARCFEVPRIDEYEEDGIGAAAEKNLRQPSCDSELVRLAQRFMSRWRRAGTFLLILVLG